MALLKEVNVKLCCVPDNTWGSILWFLAFLFHLQAGQKKRFTTLSPLLSVINLSSTVLPEHVLRAVCLLRFEGFETTRQMQMEGEIEVLQGLIGNQKHFQFLAITQCIRCQNLEDSQFALKEWLEVRWAKVIGRAHVEAEIDKILDVRFIIMILNMRIFTKAHIVRFLSQSRLWSDVQCHDILRKVHIMTP